MEHTRDHHNVQIWNAVDAKNFKQAIKLIDKRLSKGPDEYLEALRFHIHGKLHQFSDKSTILLHLEELRYRKPPLSDLDAIDLYSESLDEVLPEHLESWARIIGELKWECVKQSPKKEALCLKALEACLFKNDLHNARQIVNSIEKNFPRNHYYVFWSISILFLYSDQKNLPLRSIQTPQEILLLHRLIKSFGKPEQSIEYLNDSHLGPDSVLAKGEWELWIIKLMLYVQLEKWQELFDTTISLLKRARTKNSLGQFPEARMGDWLVWELLIRSAVELRDYLYFSKVRDEIEAQLDPESGIDKSWRRNASLAWVKFCFESSIPFSIGNDSEKDNIVSIKIIAIAKYIEEYGNASTAYIDLRSFIERLEPGERMDLLNIITGNISHLKPSNDEELAGLIEGLSFSDLSTASLITQAVNRLKLRYLLTCCIPGQDSPTLSSTDEQSKSLLELIEILLKSYQIAIKDNGRITKNLLATDRHPADDMAVLASMCLIKLSLHSKGSLNDDGTSRLLQATALLEFALKHSKSNFQIILLLIRLYSYLGCGSLAMKHYQSLSLKQIQFDTLSYTMFDRISTLHPHPFDNLPSGINDKHIPFEYLQKQQKFYQRSKDQLSRNIWLSFRHGSYNSIFQMKDVAKRLRRSISAASCVIESRKISRLISPTTKLGPLPHEYQNTSPTKIIIFSDNNDYSSFPSFENTRGSNFHELSSFFPRPSSNRIWRSLLHEQLIYIFSSSENATPQGENMTILRWLQDYVSSHKGGIDIDKTGMTGSEALAHQIYHILALITRELCNCEEHYPENFQKTLETYFSDLHENISKQYELISRLDTLIPASQHTLHVLYTAQEVGKTVLDFYGHMGRLMRHANEKLFETETEKSAIALMSKVVQKSLLIKKIMNESGWIDNVLDKMSDEVRETVDENFMEEWAGLVVESWRESTVGLNYLKCEKHSK